MKLFLLAALIAVAASTPIPPPLANTNENILKLADPFLTQNAEELSGQFEGDIILTSDQEDMVNGRNGLIATRYRWPGNVLVYEFDASVNAEQMSYIRESLDLMEASTCLRFRTREAADVDYVQVTTSSSGCFSYVGRINGRQQLNLQSNVPTVGCFRQGTIIHEFIHALGFYHMQSSYDRDDFVTIMWENIQVGMEHNFNKYTADVVTHFGVPYDFDSVMHYGPTGFSINGEPTIVPHDPNAVIGQRYGMSPADIQRLNAMYCS